MEDIVMSDNEGEHASDGEPGEDYEGVIDFPEDAQEDTRAMWDMAIDPSSIVPDDVAVPDLQSHAPMKVTKVGRRSVNPVVSMLTGASRRAMKGETLGVKFVNSKSPQIQARGARRPMGLLSTPAKRPPQLVALSPRTPRNLTHHMGASVQTGGKK
jgi:hypothetical protein